MRGTTLSPVEAQVSLMHLSVRFLHLLVGTVSLRMLFWFIIESPGPQLRRTQHLLSILVPSVVLKHSIRSFSSLPLHQLMLGLLWYLHFTDERTGAQT